MGAVYRAMDPTLDREVAIMVFPDCHAHDRERFVCFECEAKALASLGRANTVKIRGLHSGGSGSLFAPNSW